MFFSMEAKISGGTGGCSIGGGGGTPTIMLSKDKNAILFILFIKIIRYQLNLLNGTDPGN